MKAKRKPAPKCKCGHSQRSHQWTGPGSGDMSVCRVANCGCAKLEIAKP